MASIIVKFLKSHIRAEDFEIISDDVAIVKKWNWDYLEALAFQEIANEFVYQNPTCSIIIFCSHPACFTIGRGLQRSSIETHSLKEHHPSLNEKISIPIHEIKRGGGITFHHPEQIVIYPIVNLTKKKLKVYDLINAIQALIVDALVKEFKLEGLDYCRELLGLWKDEFKLASVGLQVRRFVTFHGVALNLMPNSEINEHLKFTFPCGLPGSIYSSISEVVNDSYNDEKLRDSLIEIISKNLFIKTNEICPVS